MWKFVPGILISVLISNSLAGSYTLEQLLNEANTTSKQLQSVNQEIKKAEAQINETVASAFPLISGSLNVSHSFNEVTKTSSLVEQLKKDTVLTDNFYTDKNKLGLFEVATSIDYMAQAFKQKDNSLVGSISITQPIFAQGKVGVGLKIAKLYQTTLLCKYQEAKLNVDALVTKAYYMALLSQHVFDIKSEAVKLSQETHRLSVIRLAVGKGSELDTLSSRLKLENAKIDLRKAEADKMFAYDVLITQTGIIDKPSTFSVQGDFLEPTFSISLDQAVATFTENNTMLKQLRGTGQIQDQLIKLAQSDFYPTIFAGGSISSIGQFNDPSDLGKSSSIIDDKKVYIGLIWNIFTGFKRYHKISEAKADQEIFSLNKKSVTENLELALRKAYNQVETNREQLIATKGLVALAEKGYSIAKTAYEVGSRTLIEVQQAEFDLNNARIAYNSVLFSFHVAAVDLKLLMGKLY